MDQLGIENKNSRWISSNEELLLVEQKPREKSFIKVMKDKTRQKTKGKVLHKGDEGQSKAENQRKSPS
ncbi:hypothetical protein [Oceanobacillus piezotolerans]|nr:hypothetical protein [Oceanobacillus piezotolerans]